MAYELDWAGPLHTLVFNPDSWETESFEIPRAKDGDGYRLSLQCIHGADAVHIPVSDGRGVRFRCEVPAEPGTLVELRLKPNDNGGLMVDTPMPRLRLLPADAAGPLAPIAPPNRQGRGAAQADAAVLDVPWQVVLVIDGTTRWFDPSQKELERRSGLLLEHPELGAEARARLADLVLALGKEAGEGRLSWGVVAFGDHQIPGVDAFALRPRYCLEPPTAAEGPGFRRVGELDPGRILKGLPATPGGDIVDALGDAFAWCRSLPWLPQANKLLLLFGDSPGLSVLDPQMGGGDALLRAVAVDLEAMRLHEMGIVLATLYYGPPPELRVRPKAEDLQRYTRNQYRRLASATDYALEFAAFDPDRFAQKLIRRPYPLGRGPCYGIPVP
jgi:hypothetical protein